MDQVNFSINSKHFSTRLDADIVQLIKTLAIEHQCSIDDAKLIARQMIQNKLNKLFTEDENNGINSLLDEIKLGIKNGDKLSNRVYQLFQTMGLI